MTETSSLQLIETSDYWVLPLAGAPVVRFVVDQMFTLEVYHNSLCIHIGLEGDFKLIHETQEKYFSPEQVQGLGEALTLLNTTITTARIYKGGKLELQFNDNRRLILEPDGMYEAWHITTDRGARIICTPGGELAIWDDVVT